MAFTGIKLGIEILEFIVLSFEFFPEVGDLFGFALFLCKQELFALLHLILQFGDLVQEIGFLSF